jgi:DNA-binding GntR family transcriptional regulator
MADPNDNAPPRLRAEKREGNDPMASDPDRPAPLRLDRIQRASLHEEVYQRLCDLILDGQIAPGQTVTMQALADGFGVSIMPVREALRRLTAARALTVVFGRSIGIPPLAADLLLDLTRVRTEMEGLAAAWAAERIEAMAIARLEEAMAAMDRAAAERDAKAFLRANHAFHFTVYAAAGSDVLMGLIEQNWLRISPFFNLLRDSGNFLEANTHHRAVLAALRSRDAAAARAGIAADIAAATAVLLPLLPPAGGHPEAACNSAPAPHTAA